MQQRDLATSVMAQEVVLADGAAQRLRCQGLARAEHSRRRDRSLQDVATRQHQIADLI